ncbi:hypothetical protein C2845_PM03G18550 [Panicum miliaceum]|uniref:Rx N-terminal domain-containing protein n=1 Tax=Panicum miliaceum TaxID=4540 RepID=A0A3L6TAH8_PANMI|nr:hypothetical protein C2845_PM03G18550 [Panicum miliaceum]
MDILISAVLGELTTRSINFFTSKIFKPTPVDVEDRLRRVLLRAQVITDESMGRQITNQAMLIQLDMVRDAMYRGQYMLDTFSCQSHDEDRKDKVTRHSSSSLSKLQETLDDLSSMILDVEELVVYLMSCPRLRCQPYSMHLQLANSMFGRQTEAQLIISFLLHTHLHGAEELEVLPVVGASQVGKSTLVAHVCKDERTLTFGSTDAKMHPRLMYLTMEITRTMNSSLIGANVTARLLRDNFDARFWCKVLVFLRGSFQKHVTKFGEHPFDLMNQDRPANLGRMATPSEDFVLYHMYKTLPRG